ncbi:hypothetical protein HAX54_019749 [Datura stramonium]|uniref:Uncharacterized protein n=1 Tax=Datura stramonium TaxID=4076 RepID=A0ABS8RK09_DATST|nr:hypothetical protein [Datura stramonium]
MTSLVNKKQQEASARKEITKRRQLHDESKSDSSSGLEVHYNIENSNESPVVTTRENSKAQEVAAASASPPKFDEESDEADSDGENPTVDNAEDGNGNAEEGNDDAIESGDDDTEAKESSDKESDAEKSNEGVGDLERATTPEESSKRYFLQVPEPERLFEGYNMYWMAKTPRKYSMEMVHEFYANYYYTLEKKAPSKNAIKKEPVLDSVRVGAIPNDISKRTITRVLMSGDYTVPTETTEYDYLMEAMKGIKNLRTKDKVLHFQWMANIISKDKEGAEWVTGRKPFYKASLIFLAK